MNNRLSYNTPAALWEEALPLGNGFLGAMIYGGYETERCQLNLDRLWSGPPSKDQIPPGGPETIKKIREALDRDDYNRADELWKDNFGPYVQSYLPAADLWIDFFKPAYEGAGGFTGYNRSLALDSALHRVVYKYGSCSFERETFCSCPRGVMAVKLTSSHDKALSVQVRLSSIHPGFSVKGSGGIINGRGRGPVHGAHRKTEEKQLPYEKEGGTKFDFCLAWDTDGIVAGSEKGILTIREAHEVVLYLSGNADLCHGNALSEKNVLNAQKAGYEMIKKEHIGDVKKLYNRSTLSLGGETSGLTKDRLMAVTKEKKSDPGLAALYFNYGRYLMIAASRPGTEPMNLQGIWNDKPLAPWASNYTLNINTEMNYWPSELTGLSDCGDPLFDFIEKLSLKGEETARELYGIEEGWVAHHNSDYWLLTAPSGGLGGWDTMGSARWSCWNMGGAWLCQHLWEHFLFTGDINFLEQKAYKPMKGAARFMLKWLIEDKDGTLVTSPSTSPENDFSPDGGKNFFFSSKGSTMDRSIIHDLFTAVIKASRILNRDHELTQKLEEARQKLTPLKIGRHGQLQEWKQDWDDPKDTHRHTSHLFSLFPGREIVASESPHLAKACAKSLELRGFEGTGWSKAWKINLWARLGEGENAYRMLKSQLQLIDADPENPLQSGGVYANFFDAHPPFQIDGNFGGVSGIAEMLLQSHGSRIQLLPALPAEWDKGEVTGLHGRGGFILSFNWSGGYIKEISLVSTLGGICRLQSPNELKSDSHILTEASGPCSNILLENDNYPNGTAYLSMGYNYDLKTERGNVYRMTC